MFGKLGQNKLQSRSLVVGSRGQRGFESAGPQELWPGFKP